MPNDSLQQAIVAIKSGNTGQARRLLNQLLQAEPHNAPAWLWLAKIIQDPARQRACLDRALSLDPTSNVAQQALLEWIVSSEEHSEQQAAATANTPSLARPTPNDSASAIPAAMTGSSLKEFVLNLDKNRAILKEREAKYGTTAAPLDLLNQIEDYDNALAMTQQALDLDRDVPLAELQAEFNRLNLQISGVVFVAQEPPRKPFTGKNPYRGLLKFTEADARLFFGRTAAIKSLLGMVHYLVETETSRQVPDLIAVLGPSGSGKSSLVRAGLIPALGESQLWPIKVMLPGDHPLENLAQLFSGEVGRQPAAIRRTLAGGPQALHNLMAESLTVANKPPEAIMVLVIDQFEELFTLCDDETERRAFIDQILYASQMRHNRSLVVLTMRSDFYSKVAAYNTLAETITRHQMLVSPMTEKELREAILLPAEAVGLELEKDLVERLLADTRNAPGVLPLLQHALLELFQRREGNLLTLAAYHKIGGVEGALAHRADGVITGLTPAQQQTVRRIFMRLVQPGEGTLDTRRRATLDEVGQVTDLEAMVKKLADANLLITDNHPESNQVVLDVSHEALIQAWPLLRHWLDEDREGMRIRQQVSQAAREWAARNHDDDSLYRGARLLEVEEWSATHPTELNNLEQDFVTASAALRDREAAEKEAQRQRELAAAQKLAAAEEQRAKEAETATRQLKKEVARAKANQLAAQSHMLQGQPAAQANSLPLMLACKALLLSLAVDSQASLDVQQAFHRAVDSSPVYYHTLAGHADGVTSAVFSPDGQAIVTASYDKTAKVWDAATGRELHTLVGHSEFVTSVAYSPDGKMIVTASYDKTAKVWDAATGRELRTLVGHPDGIEVTSAAYSPDGKMIVTTSHDKTAKVWDATTGQELLILTGHSGSVTSAIYSPDGQTIVTASWDNTAKVWDATTGQELYTLVGHSAWVSSAAYSPDGQKIVTASDDKTAKVWDAAGGWELRTLVGHSDKVSSATYNPNGQTIITTSEDKTIKVWDVATWRELRTLVGHSEWAASAVFSPDGQTIVTGSYDKTAKVWAAAVSSQELRTLVGHSAPLTSAAFSPDGQTIVTGSYDKTAKVWDAATGRELRTLEGYSELVTSAAFSPDGQTIVTTSWNVAKVLEAATGRELHTLVGHSAPLNLAAYSPDGQTIVTASNDRTAKVWDAASGQELRTLVGHSNRVTSATYSPDGQTIVTVSWDQTAKVWDAVSGRELRTLAGHSHYIDSVAYSPDGKTIVTTSWDKTAKVWEVDTGRELYTLVGHSNKVSSAAYSPDGQTIVTTSEDKTAKVWNAATGRELRTLEGHSGGVSSVAYSPDGQTIVTTGYDSTAKVWAANLEQRLAWAAWLIKREPPHFTPAEQDKFGLDGPELGFEQVAAQIAPYQAEIEARQQVRLATSLAASREIFEARQRQAELSQAVEQVKPVAQVKLAGKPVAQVQLVGPVKPAEQNQSTKKGWLRKLRWWGK